MRILFDRFITPITPDVNLTRRLSLGSDSIARKLACGNNWKKIRVGLHYQFVDVGSAPVGTPKLYVGVGTWLGGVGTYQAHFLGMRTTGATWTRNVASGITNYGNMTTTSVKVVGQTETTSGSGSIVLGASQAQRRWIIIVDIDKTNPAAVVVTCYNSTNGSTGAYDFTYDMFIDAMEAVTPNNNQHTKTTLSSTVTIDEATNGPLNAVNINWCRTNFPLEISGVAVGFYDAFS